MLFPVAGATFFIADLPTEDPSGMPDVPDASWVEINETEALGSLGGRYDLEEVHGMSDGPGEGYTALKGAHRPDTMQVVLGLDPTDPGQLLLFKAYRSRDAFPFRLLFSDRITERRWFAMVLGLGEVFDAANNVMRLQVELHPATIPQR
ncbi:hypothetical protein [Paracoccus haeundaensis]|uniref:Phage tail protein n=1 Tax=Paracoccus haeundaensis TaxID=225362 RepID=A0A5C4RBC9_9RHOB|nr:hypothetical protein [Paracoccus haeundaensis]TNH41280.1 hypothetical protein FHD67_00770 [Paracoccus haeundaensis]